MYPGNQKKEKEFMIIIVKKQRGELSWILEKAKNMNAIETQYNTKQETLYQPITECKIWVNKDKSAFKHY